MSKVLVVSAHPDDETLGCGGYLLKSKQQGDALGWLIATNITKDPSYKINKIKSRQKEIEKVAKKFGFNETFKLDFATARLDTLAISELIQPISKVFNSFRPETILLPHHSDAHSDHRVLFEAVMACTKSFRYAFIKKVMTYECISETEFAVALSERCFNPNYFVDITKYLKRKQSIMKIYASELGQHPFPRSLRNIEALATFRGAMAGVEYAEAFQLLKLIEK